MQFKTDVTPNDVVDAELEKKPSDVEMSIIHFTILTLYKHIISIL